MLNRKVDALEERTRNLAEELKLTKSQTLQQRLAKRYFIQSLFGLILPLMAPMLVMMELPVWLAVFYGLSGIVLGGINLWFARFISRSGYTSMPIVDAMAHAARVIRLQIKIKHLGYILALLICTPLLYEIWNLGDPELFIAGCVGGVIGGIVGFYKHRANNRIARQLIATLENDIKQ